MLPSIVREVLTKMFKMKSIILLQTKNNEYISKVYVKSKVIKSEENQGH